MPKGKTKQPWMSITNVATLGILGDEVQSPDFDPAWVVARARHALVLGAALGAQSPERTPAIYVQESPDQGEFAYMDNQDAINEWVAESGKDLRSLDDLTILHALSDTVEGPEAQPRVDQEQGIYWAKLCFLYGACFGATQPKLLLRLLATSLATASPATSPAASWAGVHPVGSATPVAPPATPQEALESAVTLITHYEADYGPLMPKTGRARKRAVAEAAEHDSTALPPEDRPAKGKPVIKRPAAKASPKPTKRTVK